VSVNGRHGVTVTSSLPGAAIRGYFYGVVGVGVSQLTLSKLNVSGNWKDPNASTGANACYRLIQRGCEHMLLLVTARLRADAVD
jgi:hypothetical protein